MFLSKHKNGFYYLHFSVNGKRKSITCKTKHKREAYKYLNKFQIEKRPPPVKQVLYIGYVKFDILKYVSDNFTPSTLSIYKNAIKHFELQFEKVPLKSINSKDIETYKAERIKNVNKTTCNIEIKTLKALFNLLIKWEYLSFNPFKEVKQFSITEKQRLCFSDIEVKFIINNIEDLNFKNLVQFALYTGCRVSEIINIQYKDIDLIKRIIGINNKDNFKTKTGKNRQIPISDNLYNLLTSIMVVNKDGNVHHFSNPDTYLFSFKNNIKMTRTYISMKFKEVLRKLNFEEKWHWHCLRHTFITNLIKSGVNINFVKELSGHSEIQTTMNYIHIATNDLREAVNKISLNI